MKKTTQVATITENDTTFEVGYIETEFMSTIAYLASYSSDKKLLWRRKLTNRFSSYFTSVIVYDDHIYTAGIRIDRHDKDWREGVLCKWTLAGDLKWERKVALQQHHTVLTILPPKCTPWSDTEFGYTLNPFIQIIAGLPDDFDSVCTKLDPVSGQMWVRNYIGGSYYEWNQDFNEDLHPIRKLYHAAVEMFA